MMRRMPTLTAGLSRLSPWLVPVPTAWFIFAGMVEYMSAPAIIAAIAAVAIELVGLSAVNTALELRTYNATKRVIDPPAPAWLTYVIMGGYVVTVIILSIILDPLLSPATVARAVFPLLSLAAFGLLALQDDHARRVAGIDADKADKKLERQKAREAQQVLSIAEVATKSPAKIRQDWRKLPAEDRALIKALEPAEVARQYAIPERTAREWVAKARRNGHEAEHVKEKVTK